jgi:hypothetical protein
MTIVLIFPKARSIRRCFRSDHREYGAADDSLRAALCKWLHMGWLSVLASQCCRGTYLVCLKPSSRYTLLTFSQGKTIRYLG